MTFLLLVLAVCAQGTDTSSTFLGSGSSPFLTIPVLGILVSPVLMGLFLGFMILVSPVSKPKY